MTLTDLPVRTPAMRMPTVPSRPIDIPGLRILYVVRTLERGGAEQITYTLAAHFRALGCDVHVAYLGSATTAGLVAPLRELGCSVHWLGSRYPMGWLRNLAQLIRRTSPDLIHGHAPYPTSALRLILRSQRWRPPVVYTEHNQWRVYHWATRWANLLTYPLNDRVLAVSGHLQRSLGYPRWLVGWRMPPTEVLYHSLKASDVTDVERGRASLRQAVGADASCLIIGTVANFRPKKAHPVLVSAMKLLVGRGYKARVVLVGHGPTEPAVRAAVEAAGLERYFYFAGYRSDAGQLTREFDIFVLPSRDEGLPMALLEAMAHGVPVISTDVGGVSEIVTHEVDGLLVPSGDVATLAQSIERVIADNELRSRLGEMAKERSRAFSQDRWLRRTEQIYEELAVDSCATSDHSSDSDGASLVRR